MCEDKKSRIVIKQGSGVPTIPASTDHRNGDWIDTDIYEGEQYLDNDTGIVYTRNGSTIQKIGFMSDNFANTDLTLTGNRVHDLDGNYINFANGIVGFDATGILTNSAYGFTSDNNASSNDTTIVIENTGGGNAITVNDGNVRFINMPTYADEVSATTAGLLVGTIYKTATGELRIKL